MFPYTCNPEVAHTLARLLIDERIRDAENRRITRMVRQQRQASADASRRRPRRWSLALLRRRSPQHEPLSAAFR
jgi:hypothetical protein